MEVFILAIGIFFALIIIHGTRELDRARIKEEIEKRGDKLVSITRDYFGKGWFGDQSNRIYLVTYQDQLGHQHEVSVKTSMHGAVYYTEDKIIVYNENSGALYLSGELITDREKDLMAENEQLKKQLDVLRDAKLSGGENTTDVP